jgi:hypothetical protein
MRKGAAKRPPPLRLAGVDPWGLDVARGERPRRIHLPGPIATAEDPVAVLSAMRIGH